jgi:quinol monooxygenase YgiN
VLKQTSLVALISIALVVAAEPSRMVEGARVDAAGQAQQQATPPAIPDGPRFIVTYVEVAPASESQALALMKAYRDTTRRGDGNVKAEVLQRIGRPGHFVITEEWRDDGSWKAHRQSAHTMQFQEKLKALRVAPYDERMHTGHAIGTTSSAPGNAVLIVTHVDVVPPGHVQVREMLKTLADASRKDAGNVRFDVLQGVRQNHFTVLEGWRDQRSYEAHLSAAHTKTFREELQPRATDGAPYDERLYRAAE